MRIAGIAGSLREGSLNRGLLRAAVELDRNERHGLGSFLIRI
jgi:NAD(P)H-dependent FMN reductase